MSNSPVNPADHQAQIIILERRLNDFDKWKAEVSANLNTISQTLSDSKNFQNRTCDEMKESRQEIMKKLDVITATMHQMQLESVSLSAGIKAKEESRAEQKTDTKWWTELMIRAPGLLIALAAIFAALKFVPKGN